MSRALAIAGREWRAMLLSPGGYIIMSLFLAISGTVFIIYGFDQGRPASMRAVFEWGTWLFLFICPAITMRAFAEEKRMGTFEMLMTSPVAESQLVIGKFFGAWAFLAVMLLPTLVQVLALECYGRPDYGELLCGYLGLLLAGAVYLSSGILASTLTSSQTVAFLCTILFWVIFSVGSMALPQYLPAAWAEAISAADPTPRLRDFAIGLVDSANLVFFTSLTLVFLVVSVKVLQAGRCR